jgi:hypothetical protein
MGLNPQITDQGTKLKMTWTPDLSGQGYRFYVDGQAVSRTFKAEAASTTFNKEAGSHRYGIQVMDVIPPLEEVVYPSVTPPVGTVHDIKTFADVKSNNWGQPYVNRWYHTPGTNAYWPSINAEAIEEILTAHGPGFRFRVTQEMQGGTTGAKQVMLHDQNHYISHTDFLGKTQEIQFKVMFPLSNPNPWYNPGYDDWNALMEMIGDTNVHNQIGLNASGRFYCRSWGHIHGAKAVGPQAVRGQWYTLRWLKKWSYGADGLTQFYVDDVKYADWPGPSIEPNKKVSSFQWGYYSAPPPTGVTEIHYAGMKVIDY